EVGDRLIETLRNAEGEEIRRAFESAGASLAEQVPPADQINPESLRELRELGRQRLIPLRTETLPTLLPLRLTTEPSSAQLVVRTPSGREVGGSGRFEGVFEQGDELSVTARAEGFESRSFDITMEGEQGYTATITLPELPEREQPDEDEEEQEERGEAGEDETGEGEATEVPSVEEREISFSPPEDLDLPEPVFLTVLTRPGRARIIRNGSTLGEGSAFIETEVGERISLEAELDGFLPVRRTVEVTAEMEPVVEIRLEPQVTSEEIVVVTEPSNAEIFFDGSRVGRGTVSRSFETGEQFSVVARAEGYFEANRTITVRPGSGGTYRLELEEEPRVKEITLLADPPSTRIEVNGEFAGRGRHTARYEWGSQLEVELSAPGYLGSSERITVREDGPERFEFSLEEEPEFATLTVQSVPGDARILINGREARRGEQAREFEIGRSVTVEASRPGFEPLERQLTIEEDRRLELRLEPAPVEGEVDYAGDPLVRGFAVAGEDLLFADREGRIYRYTIEGDEIWSHQSANAPNENSIPVVGNGRVYLTGAAEAIALDLDTGEQLFRLPLSEESSHLFGRTVTSLEEGRVLFPDNQGIQLLSGEDGSLVSRIDIPNGGRSSVAVAGNGVLVDQDGVFHIIDLDDLTVVGTVETALVQPVAARPGIVENVAVAVDRRGRAAGVDLEAEELLWEREVSSGGLFSDPLATGEGVFFTSDGSLYALEAQTGRPLFESIAGITTPPAAAEGSLFVGRGTEVLELDPGTGAVRRSLDLGAEVTGRPAIIGERLVVATEEGRFLVINRTGWVASDSAADAGN
ncbi:MAG: PQQ-binding-like beta-propeller repeat protein, partial [Alkalispirochaetaceae bacterium]